MYMMVEEAFPIEGEVRLDESTGSKSYYIKGTFSTIGVKNRNGRIYPQQIWESEVFKYQSQIQENSINSLMEYEHPADRTHVDPINAVAKIVELRIVEDKVIGKAKLLNNPKANILKNLIDEGIKIGVSSRGIGKVGSNSIIEQFNLITYDVVANPSDYAANLTGLSESLKQTEYDIDPQGHIVKICSKDRCIMEHRDDVDKAVLSIFGSLFETAKESKEPKESKESNSSNDSSGSGDLMFKTVKFSDLHTILKYIENGIDDKRIRLSVLTKAFSSVKGSYNITSDHLDKVIEQLKRVLF